MTFHSLSVFNFLIYLSNNLKLPASTSNYQSIQSQLKQAAEGLGVATNDLSFACRERPEDLAAASSVYKVKFGEVIDAGLQMAGQWKVSVHNNVKDRSLFHLNLSKYHKFWIFSYAPF